ncbi:hypothetical protein KQI65_12270 [bacterium]|nr:hypothetical protein [bacterium]
MSEQPLSTSPSASRTGTPPPDGRFPLLRTRATAVTALLYLAAGLAMTQIRLLNTLGYESALVFALIAAFAGGVLSLRLLRDVPASLPVPALATHWLRVAGTGALLLVLPAAVLTVNAAFVRNCAMFDGAGFWLLLPFPTVLFTSALVLLLRLVAGRRAGLLYALLILLFLLQPFVQIYTRPQLFAYNHVFGMFLGLSWDQTQPPFLTLLLYRLSTLAYVVLLLGVSLALQQRRRGGVLEGRMRLLLLAMFIPALAATLYFAQQSDALGFTNSYEHLREELGAKFSSGDVDIYYDSTQVSGEDIRLIAREHRFQLKQVCTALQVQWKGRLQSYLYPDSRTKKRLLGTESSQIARPWKKEIHLSMDYWRESLKHEIVHVVAGAFGPYINHAPFVRVLGLTEGLAMAVEWSWGNRTLHQHAAAMLNYGLLPTARQCISTIGFATNSSSVSYVASGSLTRWLMDSLGVPVIRRAYAEDNLEEVIGISYEEMNSRWRRYLRTVQRARPDSIATLYAFKRPSLFTAVCPRVITEQSRDAAEALRDFRFADALQMYRETEQLAPNARAVFGMTGALYQLGEMDSVRSLVARYLIDSTRAYSLYPLLLWEGAAAWKLGDSLAADRALTRLLTANPSGWPTALAQRMRNALRIGGAARPALRHTLLGALRRERNEDSLRNVRSEEMEMWMDSLGTAHPAAPLLLDEWLRLVARDSSGRRQALTRIAWLPVDRMPTELLMRCGAVYYALGENGRAKEFFRKALMMTAHRMLPKEQMLRLEIQEWLERCRADSRGADS